MNEPNGAWRTVRQMGVLDADDDGISAIDIVCTGTPITAVPALVHGQQVGLRDVIHVGPAIGHLARGTIGSFRLR